MNFKKISTLIFTILFIFQLPLFAQEEQTENSTSEEDVNLKGEEFHQSDSFLDFIQSMDFVLQMEPAVYLNPNKTNSSGQIVSAPSPIVYPISIGILWPNYTFIAMQPTLSFFMMNHLWYDGMALPAEIENRTTTTLCFMLNLPVVFSLYFQKFHFQLEAGLGIFMRFGLKASGVEDSDYGYSGSAGSDISNINSWFWKDMHWLYLTTGGSWMYHVNDKLKIGPVANIYLPIGTLINQASVNGLVISVGFRICR